MRSPSLTLLPLAEQIRLLVWRPQGRCAESPWEAVAALACFQQCPAHSWECLCWWQFVCFAGRGEVLSGELFAGGAEPKGL